MTKTKHNYLKKTHLFSRLSQSQLDPSMISWYKVKYFCEKIDKDTNKLAITYSSASFHRDWKVFSGTVLILLSISNLNRIDLLLEAMLHDKKCCFSPPWGEYLLWLDESKSNTDLMLQHLIKLFSFLSCKSKFSKCLFSMYICIFPL